MSDRIGDKIELLFHDVNLQTVSDQRLAECIRMLARHLEELENSMPSRSSSHSIEPPRTP